MPPPSRPDAFSTPADCAACRGSIRQGSHSFYLASQLLPAEIRQPSYAVYAFCRFADDLIDREAGGIAAIDELGRMLDRIYAGRPGQSFVERGFADVVAHHAIPRAIPDALIEGLGWDAAGRRYASLDELTAYAVRVAGTVGFMMTLVMGRRDGQVLARACDLGVAMQFTNIARDIGEDARNGRLYLPLDWLEEAGIDADAWIVAPVYSAAIRGIVARLLGEAEALYARSAGGIAALPSGCRLGINTARLLYRGIGEKVFSGLNPVAERAVTRRREKLALMARAARLSIDAASLPEPVLRQAAFLVEAVLRAPAPRAATPLPPWWDVGARSARMIELLNGISVRQGAGER